MYIIILVRLKNYITRINEYKYIIIITYYTFTTTVLIYTLTVVKLGLCTQIRLE